MKRFILLLIVYFVLNQFNAFAAAPPKMTGDPKIDVDLIDIYNHFRSNTFSNVSASTVTATAVNGIIVKKPDGTCAACGADNANTWSCSTIPCP